MRIIPAIDIIDGKCVRLTQGNYMKKKIYHKEPLDVAKRFEDNGMRYLHLVDLDGAKNKRITNWKILEKVAMHTTLYVDFGGGMNQYDDLRIAFECGARQVNIGTMASKNPQVFLKWLHAYGTDKIILSADCKNRKIVMQAWQKETEQDVVDYILSYEKDGVKNVVCTDINKDGKLEGPSISLYRDILKSTKNIQLIASGGIASMNDIEKLLATNIYGVIIGKAIYEEKITLKELQSLC